MTTRPALAVLALVSKLSQLVSVDVVPALVAGTLAGLLTTIMRAALAWAGVRLRLDILEALSPSPSLITVGKEDRDASVL